VTRRSKLADIDMDEIGRGYAERRSSRQRPRFVVQFLRKGELPPTGRTPRASNASMFAGPWAMPTNVREKKRTRPPVPKQSAYTAHDHGVRGSQYDAP
jgi:hypothetical protein